MGRNLPTIVFHGAVMACFGVASAQSQAQSTAGSTITPDPTRTDLSSLPPLPHGKSTILGGAIRDVDPVMDRLTLNVFGQKPIKILFDERTQVYRDGQRISLHQLGPCEHASVQTTLDGTDVFALSVHLLSTSPQGDYQGRVLNYSAGTHELTLAGPGAKPLTLMIAQDTSVTREGQSANPQASSSDLVSGSLVSASFQAGKEGRGVATHIAILATPGSEVIFSGRIVSLDVHQGRLVLVDPRDEKDYQISFDSSHLPESRDLLTGANVRVVTEYDGTRYVATQIHSNE